MLLYHTSLVKINHPDINHSREFLDFGKGFYLTAMREQAVKYANRFLGIGKSAFLHVFEFDEQLHPECRVKKFESYSEEWLDFVAACRKGAPHPQFDIIEGGIANDQVYLTVDLYFSGLISKEEALGRLVYEKPNHQICILSQQVLDQNLKLLSIEKLTK